MKHLLFAILLVGCYETPTCPLPEDAGPADAGVDAPAVDSGILAGDFRMTVVTAPIQVRHGEDVTVLVRIDRGPGFDDPILIRSLGIPEEVTLHPRENRPEDIDGITPVVIHAGDGSQVTTGTPFVIQGTDGRGLVHNSRVVIEVTPPL